MTLSIYARCLAPPPTVVPAEIAILVLLAESGYSGDRLILVISREHELMLLLASTTAAVVCQIYWVENDFNKKSVFFLRLCVLCEEVLLINVEQPVSGGVDEHMVMK